MKILVVDDEEFVTFHLGDLFRQRGHEVSVASNGLEAIRIATSTNFDVILCDVFMPSCGGLRVLQRVRGAPNCAKCLVVLMSAIARRDVIDEAMASGADSFMAKPLSLSDLVYEVEALVEEALPPRTADGHAAKGLIQPPDSNSERKAPPRIQSDQGLKRGKIPTGVLRRAKDKPRE